MHKKGRKFSTTLKTTIKEYIVYKKAISKNQMKTLLQIRGDQIVILATEQTFRLVSLQLFLKTSNLWKRRLLETQMVDT
jgi:hypothetical protein